MTLNFRFIKSPLLTDYVASRIAIAMHDACLIETVGNICSETDNGGWSLSPTKTLHVKDANGSEYKITVQQIS
jgi:hypothetical protein